MQLADVRADASSDLSFLPPLPQPDYNARKIEARRGFSVVFGLISVFVVLTHGVGPRRATSRTPAGGFASR